MLEFSSFYGERRTEKVVWEEWAISDVVLVCVISCVLVQDKTPFVLSPFSLFLYSFSCYFNTTVFPVFADSLAASNIFTTTRLFSME